MPDPVPKSPAEMEAERAQARVVRCLDERRSFRLEAGAGSGKTYSLVEALRHLIQSRGDELVRRHQRVACITYTNVAVKEIQRRTHGHAAIHVSTIHALCWSLISSFQPELRRLARQLPAWSERLQEAQLADFSARAVVYDLGHRRIEDGHVHLHHDDVLALMTQLLSYPKFRVVVASRFPVILIDEYQDTDAELVEALKLYVLGSPTAPVLGLFGDHWQRIYESGCGLVEHPAVEAIDKHSNFRSAPAIVECLNRLRPELPQQPKDPTARGTVTVFHSNQWVGARQAGQHWGGDLPSDVASEYVRQVRQHLERDGWDFSPNKTKVLMLTNRVLAREQGFADLHAVFPFAEQLYRKEHAYISFLVDVVEPACMAFVGRKYAAMFEAVGARRPPVLSRRERGEWASSMATLIRLRDTGTVGEVLRHLRQSGRPRLPDDIESAERRIENPPEQIPEQLQDGEQDKLEVIRSLHSVRYKEVAEVSRFIRDETPFSTKHGAKGTERENVLVVLGRGWNRYNFGQFLEDLVNPAGVPADKREAFERNRNLFYVVCSRAISRLTLLFTQRLSDPALNVLQARFGRDAVQPWTLRG